MKTSRILLVDDEPRILQALRRTLTWDGYQIFTATNARDALDLMLVDPVDLVISDNMMPNVTGIEMLSQMHKLWPDTVRVMLTGLSDHEVALKALEQGSIFRFLTKPWDDVDLRITVRQALEHRASKLESRHLLDFMDRRHENLETLVDVVAAAKV
ncbi:MAG: response regulator [Myxococcaceae bacterium]|nr:response regulator [Myxococcaceae bacterium]